MRHKSRKWSVGRWRAFWEAQFSDKQHRSNLEANEGRMHCSLRRSKVVMRWLTTPHSWIPVWTGRILLHGCCFKKSSTESWECFRMCNCFLYPLVLIIYWSSPSVMGVKVLPFISQTWKRQMSRRFLSQRELVVEVSTFNFHECWRKRKVPCTYQQTKPLSSMYYGPSSETLKVGNQTKPHLCWRCCQTRKSLPDKDANP